MESINIRIAGLGTVSAEVVKQLKVNANFLHHCVLVQES